MPVLRNANVTLPGGARLRNVRVTLEDSALTVVDRRTAVVLFQADVLDADRALGRAWTLTTDEGTLVIRSGCGCGR
jgi:hypothetical protein